MPVPYINYIPGHNCPASWTRLISVAVSAGTPAYTYAAEAVLPVLEHSWQEMIDKIDVTNTLSGGYQALIAGIARGTFTMKVFMSLTAPRYSGLTHYNPAGFSAASSPLILNAGTKGTLKHFATPTSGIIIPAMITAINDTVNLTSAVEYDVTAELDVNAGVLSYF